MNAVAGFETPSEGAVRLDGAEITGPGADRGMVFQQPTLCSPGRRSAPTSPTARA